MKKYVITMSIFLASYSLYSQSTESNISELESRISILEKRIEAQKDLNKAIYEAIKLDGYRAMLSLNLNRNFTYYAEFSTGESIVLDDGQTRDVYYFSGFQSFNNFSQALNNNRSEQLSTIRGNLKMIRKIVVDNDYFGFDGKPQNQLIIEYYDNSSASQEAFIIADVDKNSLKVRINGVMTEVGWE